MFNSMKAYNESEKEILESRWLDTVYEQTIIKEYNQDNYTIDCYGEKGGDKLTFRVRRINGKFIITER